MAAAKQDSSQVNLGMVIVLPITIANACSIGQIEATIEELELLF
jgi:hypothetical protein